MNWLHRGARPLLLALLGAICIITGSAVLAFGPNIAVVASAASTTSATHHYDLPTQHAMRRTGAEPAAAQQVTSRAVVRLLTRATTSSVAAKAPTPMSQLQRIGSALKADPYHRATSFVVDNPAAKRFAVTGGDGVQRSLYQLAGEVNGKPGVFEWLVDSSGAQSVITHQRFIPGGSVTGFMNQVP